MKNYHRSSIFVSKCYPRVFTCVSRYNHGAPDCFVHYRKSLRYDGR